MATERHIDGLNGGAASQERMPVGVRRVMLGVLAVLAALATYLVVVRGDALLLDLQAMGSRIWCW